MPRLCSVHVHVHVQCTLHVHVRSDEFPLFSVDCCPLIDIIIANSPIRHSSTEREEGGDQGGGEEDTLTPPTTSSPGSVVGGVTSASSVVWAKGGLCTGSGLRQVSQLYLYVHVHAD